MGGDAVGHKTAQEGGGEQQEPGSLPRVIHSKKTPGKQWSIHDLEKKKPEKTVCTVEKTTFLLPGDMWSGEH